MVPSLSCFRRKTSNGAVTQSLRMRPQRVWSAKCTTFYWFTVAKRCVTRGNTSSLRRTASAWPRSGQGSRWYSSQNPASSIRTGGASRPSSQIIGASEERPYLRDIEG